MSVQNMSDTFQTLLDAAEDRIRLKGYHAVSFRDLADELGIKSSSVHYHFPQKQDLGLALVERYSQRFFAALENASKNAKTSDEKIRAYCSIYRQALTGADRICLCGMLGAESAGLPEELSMKISRFFEANKDWLLEALPQDMSKQQRTKKALLFVASLQGAMMLANSHKDYAVFDQTVESLLNG